MKSIYLAVVLTVICGSLQAQLDDGTPAPLWTLSDFQTGESYTLQDYIDQGIPVIIDFSATWCTFCWNYHQTHVLADMYNEYGPTGTSQQDAAMVFFIEGIYNSNDACLLGDNANCSSSTLGDWTVGTPYPIFNIESSSGIKEAYEINSWPTLYAISPQGTVYEVGQASKSTWESWLFETFALEIEETEVTQILCPQDGGVIDITVSGGAGNLSYLWSNGDTSEDLINVPPGEYSVVITEGRGYSIESEIFIIEAAPEPLQASLSGQDVSCFGGQTGEISAHIEGGVGEYSYLWSNGETTQTISGLSSGTYSVDVLDENNCFISSSYFIDQPQIIESSTQTTAAHCGEENGSITIQAQGGTLPYIYSIEGSENEIGQFFDLESGIYEGFVEDANGCILPLTLGIEEIEEPEAVITVGDMPTCDNLQVVLNGSESSIGNVTYFWSSDNGGTIVDGQGTVFPTIEGDGTYNLVVTDQTYNCTSSAMIVIEGDIQEPIADAGLNQTITCEVLEVELNGTNSSQGANFTYHWSTSDGNILSGENSDKAIVNAAGEYSILVTNIDNGCTSTSEVTVIQTADLPTADAGQGEEITCALPIVTLDGSNSESGNDIQYSWSTSDGVIIEGENTLSPKVNAPGTYLLEVLNTVSGCVSFASVIVSENTNAPEAEILEADLLTCILDEQALVVMVDAENVSYVWSTTDGNIVEGSNSQMPIIDAPGTYTVTFTNETTGCSGSQSILVDEFINSPMAAFTFMSDKTIFSFTNSSQGNPSLFEWDFGDGNSSMQENPIHEYLESGEYQVCLTITNECGSIQTCNNIVVTVGAPLSYTSIINSISCNALCDGSLIINPDADVSEITTIVTGPNDFVSEDLYNISGLCTGIYTIEITNEIEETIMETIEIFEPDAILVEESEVVHIDCAGNENGRIEIDVSGGTGILSVEWNNGAEGLILEDLPGGEYQATIKDEQGCTHVVDFIVEEPTEVDVDVIDITNIDADNPTGAIDIEVTGGVEPYEYLWSNGDQTEDAVDLDFGEYTVIVTDANGCQDTYGPYEIKNLVAINDIEKLQLFNVTPNPTTDDFTLKLEFQSKTDARISLINNLGQEISNEVISSSVYTKNYNVSDLPSGMYMLRIQVGNEVSIKKIVKQ